MSEVIKISREEAIEHLIKSTFDHIEQCPETLDSYLRYGFRGFDDLSDEELIEEYRDYVSEDNEADIEIILEEGV